jgi:site-specific DNA recombinase
MRCSVYARFSSDLQRDTSLDDQIAVAQRYAAERGWHLDPEHVYRDAGVSGASMEGRAGLEALLAGAGQQPRPFDIVLVDDTSRVARDIADAIRIMQRLTFWGIRVIYISQGIDSASEQADALVTVHGLIDSLYLKELAKKVSRGIRGQHARGYATGSKTFGYRTVPVIDPSGRKDERGYPARLGCRIQVDEEEAKTVRQVFEWAADGVGTYTIIARLNAGGWPAPRGAARWTQTTIRRVLSNERYRGLHIYGQSVFERVPGSKKAVSRRLPREQWQITERPDLRIISDELWERVQAVRAARRQASPAKGPFVHGSDARLRSKHLFTGLARCGICGSPMTVVTGGKGSPRFGCRVSWRQGTCCCPNRLTIMAKVAEPQILRKLQAELLEPETLSYITEQVRAALAAHAVVDGGGDAVRKQLADERRKRDNLVGAIEEGGENLSVLLTALKGREANIRRLEADLARLEMGPPPIDLEDLPWWVERQLQDFHALLKDNPERVKAEFRRLNLHLQFIPVDYESDNAYYRVEGQCDLSALALSTWAKSDAPAGALLGRLRERAGSGKSSSPARSTGRVQGARVRSAHSTARRCPTS